MTPAHEIALQISQFIFQECKGDYAASARMADSFRVTGLTVNEDEPNIVTIKTPRPGILIGRKGRTIEALSAYLGKKVHIVEDPDNWVEWMTPINPDDYL